MLCKHTVRTQHTSFITDTTYTVVQTNKHTYYTHTHIINKHTHSYYTQTPILYTYTNTLHYKSKSTHADRYYTYRSHLLGDVTLT